MLVFIAFFQRFLYLYLFYWKERKRERIMLLLYFATTLSELSQINIQYSHKISWFFIWWNADFSRRDFSFIFSLIFDDFWMDLLKNYRMKSPHFYFSQSFFPLGQWKYHFFTLMDVEMPHLFNSFCLFNIFYPLIILIKIIFQVQIKNYAFIIETLILLGFLKIDKINYQSNLVQLSNKISYVFPNAYKFVTFYILLNIKFK